MMKSRPVQHITIHLHHQIIPALGTILVI